MINLPNIKKGLKSGFNIEGLVTTEVFDMRDKKALAIEKEIENHIANQPTFETVAKQNVGYLRRFLIDKHFDIFRILSTDERRQIVIELQKLKDKHRYAYKHMVAELQRLFKVREYQLSNLIVTVGRAAVAQRLTGDTTYTTIINYGALGTDNTAVANGDTTLGTEVFRKTRASESTSDNVAFIDFFYSKSDTNGTYEEFGTFIDGTASADSGQMFTHALTGGWTKTASESMTVAVQYTVS